MMMLRRHSTDGPSGPYPVRSSGPVTLPRWHSLSYWLTYPSLPMWRPLGSWLRSPDSIHVLRPAWRPMASFLPPSDPPRPYRIYRIYQAPQ